MWIRPSLGHTGRPLTADGVTQACYVLAVAGAVVRILAALGLGSGMLLELAGLAWSLSFLGFAIAYWRVLVGGRIGTEAASG